MLKPGHRRFGSFRFQGINSRDNDYKDIKPNEFANRCL